MQFSYQNGLLQALTTPDGLVLTYGYNSGGVRPGVNDRLVSVRYSTSPQTSQAYLYENSSFPYALTGIIDENGARFATWTYDASGRATSSQHAGGADLTQIAYNADGSRTVTDPLGEQTVYTFVSLQGVPKVTQINRLVSASTAAATRAFSYDANGYTASQTDWNGNLTTYVNDTHGQPTIITEASGTPQARTTAITYDPVFHLPTKVVELGLTTDFVYDGSGNLLNKTLTDTTTTTIPYSTNGIKRTWTNSWGANGLLASAKGPRTDVSELTSFAYDASGTLIKITNALGQITRVTQHTPGGLPQTVIDLNNVTTQLAYDSRLRLTSSTLNTGAGALTTRYAWDAAGNPLSVTLPDGSSLTNAYDAAHKLTGVADLFNQKTSYTLDALGDRTQANVTNVSNVVKRSRSDAFDALGRLSQDTGGAGQATEYSYDGNGNALTVTDPLSRVTNRAFDALNRLFQVKDPANGISATSFDAHDRPLTVTAPNGAVTSYVYDGFGDLIQTTSPDTGKAVYRYDLAGNLTQRVDATGAIANYTYDALDRVLTTKYPADATENVTYTYDQVGHGFSVGRLTSVTDGAGTLSRSYDERGNVLSERRGHGNTTLVTSYTYDAGNRVSSITYPSRWSVVQSRDAMGRITAIAARAPGSSTSRPVVSGVAYQPFGPVSALTYGNGVAEARSFDLDYRLTRLTGTGTAPLQNLAYGYDAANNVLSAANGVTAANSQSFVYDLLDRLTSATGNYGTFGYSYDAVGNRLNQTLGSATTAYTYAPQSNRLTGIKTGPITQTIGTTESGDISSSSPAPLGFVTGFAYNQANRLASTSFLTVPTARYTYDAFGHRIVKVGLVTGTTLYQYDLAGHLLEESDGQGDTRVDYVYLDGRPVATIQPSNNKMYFLHDDRLGTPQVATDSSQTPRWTASYQPFGETSTGVGLIVQNLRLPGQELDLETGLYHNGFRDYAPTLGRYLESDPIGLTGGLNTFAYAGQNPARWVDPQGMFLDPISIGIGAALGAVGGYTIGGFKGAAVGAIAGGVAGVVAPWAAYDAGGGAAGVVAFTYTNVVIAGGTTVGINNMTGQPPLNDVGNSMMIAAFSPVLSGEAILTGGGVIAEGSVGAARMLGINSGIIGLGGSYIDNHAEHDTSCKIVKTPSH